MDINYINENFPNIELSYDKIHHKKVPNLHLAIPYGRKNMLWFTNFRGEDVCMLLEYDYKSKQIKNFKKIITYFNTNLAYGTILYGTVVKNKNSNFFVCENIYYYCGKNVLEYPYKNILFLFDDMFKNNINSIAYTNQEYIITLCMMHNDKNTLMTMINNENYNIYGILNRNINNRYYYLTPLANNNNYEKIYTFKVMADLKYNVYKLYCYTNKGLQLYQKTYIPDYKTSVMLNDKFRIIKENSNLDLLEESDDEEEFENINEDKYVYLDKYYNFKCYFHNKIKRWVPKEISYEKKIVTYNDLQRKIESNKH
tara:strand:+ start:86 stop:1021 length:936 start_codon:yes stop_codon:yes gene_type:complete